MDSKAGREERNTHGLNREEGIKTKLERRKRRLDDYLLSKRILPNLPTEAFIEPEQQYKAPEALEDKTKKKKSQVNKKVNSTCPTTNIEPGNLRKDVGYANHPTITRRIILKSSVSTVTSWDMRRNIATREKSTLSSIGYGR